MDIYEIADTAAKVIAAASAVAAITPTPKDDGVVALLKKILNFFALNILHAKSAPKK